MTGAAGGRTRTALVTGGTGGIGRVVASKLAADGFDVDDVHVSVTRFAPDLPAPRLELLHYHVGSRRPIPHDTASNDIAVTHTVVQVTSLDATAAALARHGTPLADDIVILHEGMRAAMVSGPEVHRFLVEEAGGG